MTQPIDRWTQCQRLAAQLKQASLQPTLPIRNGQSSQKRELERSIRHK